MNESNNQNTARKYAEYYLPCKSLWLLELKNHTGLKLYKTYGEISIDKTFFNYLSDIDNYTFAKLVSLLIIFAGKDDIVRNLCETDMAEMIGVGRSTIQKYIAKYKNTVFNVLSAEHNATMIRSIAGDGNQIACNSYLLLNSVFAGFADTQSAARKNACQTFKFKYKNLKNKNYFTTIYNNNISK